jgi:hypothetical protein
MRNLLRFSLRFLLVVGLGLMPAAGHTIVARAADDWAARPAHQRGDVSIQSDPLALYQALNELKLDGTHVYMVHDLTLRRDAVRFAFTDGTLAFLQPIGGHLTGAVFSGHGHVVATPRDAGERRSLSHYLGVPILDQTFASAYLRFTDDTAAELLREIESSGTEVAEDPAFAARWAPGLGTLAAPHSLRVLEDLLSAEPLPYFYALLQNDAVGRFDVAVDQRREEQVLIGQLIRESGGESYDVWASFRTEDAPAKPLEHFVPLKYVVDSTIADDLSLTGKTSLYLKAARPGERVVHLELSRNLAVSQIVGEDGKAVTFFQNQDLTPQEATRRGNDAIEVVLPAAKNVGDEFRLEVSYRGNVISNAGNGVEFVGERGTWFAHVGGEHFASFDLNFRWPKRLTLVATGAKVETHEDTEPKSGRWRSETPFATAGFNLGEYRVASTGEAPRVHIYANKELEDEITKRLMERGTTQLDNSISFVHPLNGTVTSVVAAPPPPSPSAAFNGSGKEVLGSIPGSFGQGWPGLVYLSTLAFLPATTQEQAGISEWAQRASRNVMPFHEVVHQWWGNQTVAASYRDTWIEEGLANYLAILYSESRKPAEHRLTAWLEHYRADLLVKPPGQPGPTGSNETIEQIGPLTLGPRLATPKVPEAYAAIIYGKGTWVFHMLHELMHESGSNDPDAKFRELLRSILKDYKFQTLSTADFQRAVEQHMTPAMDIEGSRRMGWFFDEWVRGTGIPQYSVKYEVKTKGTEFVVTGVLVQQGVNNDFSVPVPIYGTRVGAKAERLGTVITSGRETRFHFGTRVRPTKLVIDPHLTVLCTTN